MNNEEIAKLKERIKKLQNALSFYANKNNWLYSGMYNNKNELVIEGGLTPDWKDVYKNITNTDLEPHNNYMYYGGKLARITLTEDKQNETQSNSDVLKK